MVYSTRGPSSNLTVFVFVLALGTLLHKTQVWDNLSSPLPVLTTGLAVALLFRPDSPRMLLVFALATLAEAVRYAPFYFLAHMIFATFVCFGIVGAAAALYTKEKRLALSLAELEPYLFPLVRAGVYAMFAIVVLHKLNEGFFDPAISCAVEHYVRLHSRVPFLPDPGQLTGTAVIPIFTILAEGAIPVLLFFRRSRQLGLIVALGFHYAMAINGFQGFSGFGMAMYTPFLPREFHRELAGLLAVLRRRCYGTVLIRAVPIGFGVFAVAMTLSHAAGRTYQLVRLGYLLYVLMAPVIALIYLWLVFRRRSRPARPWPTGIPTHAWQIALLVLFIGHGFMPYLGLKTEAVFSIFSNLQTEEGRWNHLFLPESLRVAGFQNSPVTVTAIDGMKLLRPWERDYLQDRVRDADVFTVTQFELKRQIAAHCRAGQRPIALSYKIDGKSFDLSDACADPELSAGNGWLLEKIFWFRVVHDSSYPCLH